MLLRIMDTWLALSQAEARLKRASSGVVQSVERLTVNQNVAGPSPAVGASKTKIGQYVNGDDRDSKSWCGGFDPCLAC